jgi:xanthine dehydrogenase iron-sulfur cluster and FAD-binding subunit A
MVSLTTRRASCPKRRSRIEIILPEDRAVGLIKRKGLKFNYPYAQKKKTESFNTIHPEWRTGEGCNVETIEGMADGSDLHPLQITFADLGAAQCGYCTPGFLLTAKELLDKSLTPTRDEIKEALSGNLCRCTGYIKIYEAVELAAARMRGEDAEPAKESIYGHE